MNGGHIHYTCGHIIWDADAPQDEDWQSEVGCPDCRRFVISKADFPDWLTKAIDHLAGNTTDQSPEQLARRIHEALAMCEIEKHATPESRFSFTLSGATAEDIAEIRRHLTPLENSIVEISE